MLHSLGGQPVHGGALVAFTDDSRDNFDRWKESNDRLLNLHPDDLLHVARHRRFSVTVSARKTQLEILKSADIDADKMASSLEEALDDANGNLFRIILSTISHKTTHMAAQRLYGTAAMRVFPRASDPAAAVDKAVERYNSNSHNDRSEVLPLQPQRSVQLMTRFDDCLADGLATLRVDTQAEDTTLCDPAFFTELDTSTTTGITTIAAGGAPARTAGVGTARLTLADGTTLTIQRVHLLPGGKTNVLSTEKIKDKALIDFRADGLRLKNGALLPFDAAYCEFRVRPAGTRSDSAAPKRHLEAFFAQTPPRSILCHPLHRRQMLLRARGFRGSHQGAARSLLPA